MTADGLEIGDGYCANQEENRTQIQNFYTGKTIFITGGTGFIGKLLIEKLIHTYPDIKKILLLIRDKKGKDVKSRIDDIGNNVVFERVKRDVGPITQYLQGIPGDCEKKGLGLSLEDKKLLQDETEIVIHAAATVRFDEPLRKAIDINVRATKDVIELMQGMKNLQAAIYVSTAYSNCKRKDIEEQFYPLDFGCDEALRMSGDILDAAMDDKFLNGWPNTYTFTKALAEDVVRKYAGGLPIAIIRPSMIIGTTSAGPATGWIDNHYGPTGAMMGVGSGLIRTMEMDMASVADLVPGDLCANAIIAAAWSIHKNKPSRNPIYNFVSSPRNPITWESFANGCLSYGVTIPPEAAIWCMTFFPTNKHWLYILLRFLIHTVPAFFIDIFLVASGSKIRMLRLYRSIHKFSDVLTFFSCQEWNFSDEKTFSLWRELSEKDRKMLPFNTGDICWNTYMKEVIDGARVFLLREDISNLAHARTKYRRYVILHNIIKIIVASLLVWFFYSATLRVLNFFNASQKDIIRRIEPHVISY